jgi:putative membrane protein
MLLESLLAYAHLIAILTLVVFVSSEAALCRVEWLNAAILQRLVGVDRVVQAAALAIILTGIARTWWGVKGTAWYWGEPLLWAKVVLFGIIIALSQRPTRAFVRWRRALQAHGTLPSADEIGAARRRIILLAHLLMLIPLAAVLLARGVGVR